MKKNIFIIGLSLFSITLIAGCSGTNTEDQPSASPSSSSVSSSPVPYLTKTVPTDPNIQPSKDSVNNFTEKYCIPISEAATALSKGGNPDEIAVQLKNNFMEASTMANESGSKKEAQAFQQLATYFKDGKIPNPFLKENTNYLQTLKSVDAISKLRCDLPLLPG